MRKTFIARSGAIIAILAMVAGHLGHHTLIWTRDPVSTFAARAPLGVFISASMVLSAVTIVFVCLGFAEQDSVGEVLGSTIRVMSGMAASGLVLLCAFKETISPRLSVVTPTAGDIRMQAFHDAGHLLFFMGSLALLCLLGITWLATTRGRFRYGGVIPLMAAMVAWSTPRWPILPAEVVGLKQRVSLFFLWLGLGVVAFWFLGHADRPQANDAQPGAAPNGDLGTRSGSSGVSEGPPSVS